MYAALVMPMPTHSFPSQGILCKLAKESGCRVLVGGEGGDEVFTGYLAYLDLLKMSSTHCETSISPYSQISDQHYLMGERQQEIILNSDIHRAYTVLKLNFADTPSQRISNALFLDSLVQLSSTGLLCCDQVGGNFGIETRSPLANQKAIAFRMKCLRSQNIKNFDFQKNSLTEMLKSISPAWESLKIAKQGFSGFPNDSFTNEEKRVCYSRVSELLSYPLKKLTEFENDVAMDWKIKNMGTFLQKT
jgi:asparagine synthetase B (glutamine-hydrolysing)